MKGIVLLILITFSYAAANVTHIYTTSGDGIWFSSDKGTSWIRLPGFDLWTNDIICGEVNGLSPGVMYAATIDGVWQRDCTGAWSPVGLQGNQIYEIEKSPRSHYIFAVTKNGDIYRTTVSNNSWIMLYDDHPHSVVSELRVITEHPHTLYLSLKSVGSRMTVRKSEDHGRTWDTVYDQGPWSRFDFCMASHPDNADVVGIGGKIGFRQSLDGGASWNTGTGAFDAIDAEYRIRNVSSAPRLIIANQMWWSGPYYPGVWYSDNYCQTWYNSNLENEIPRTIALHPVSDETYVVTRVDETHYFKILRIPRVVATYDYPDERPRRMVVDCFDTLKTTVHDTPKQESEETKTQDRTERRTNSIQIAHHKNKITIRFCCSSERRHHDLLSAEVVDITGRAVRDLVGSVLPNGQVEFVWDLRDNYSKNVNPGIYFTVYKTVQNIFSEKIVVFTK
ncbi:hypothetical protein AMJ83_08185 [candidate division WOR_3 bacterium SM23_42]|uniref:FlgD Ig-like domain-containing protein n=1 Tax=candidate division WOR_3 bacterium SM23_42 TaxID=1703779 RepID=A0A0S8FUE2_UNCW3|nr:MAG: hypothetical protein AMJ83_08185 [candidate division WOR_3 bacterium SM23_42]